MLVYTSFITTRHYQASTVFPPVYNPCLQLVMHVSTALIPTHEPEPNTWFACVNIKSPAHATRYVSCVVKFNSSHCHCPYLICVCLAGLQVLHYVAVGGDLLWLGHEVVPGVGSLVVLDDEAVSTIISL